MTGNWKGKKQGERRGTEMETPTTTLVKITPSADLEVMAFYNDALKLAEYAEKRVIARAEDLKPATDDLSLIAKIKKALEEKRKEYVKPLQDHVKTINDAFEFLMEPIKTADKVTRAKILAFQAQQERIRREQEEINRLRIEAAQKEMELKGELTEPVNLVEVMVAPKIVRTEMGTVGQRLIAKWEVVNFSQVPDEFKIIDSAKVTKLVKGGGTIPGIRVWQEPILAVNTR